MPPASPLAYLLTAPPGPSGDLGNLIAEFEHELLTTGADLSNPQLSLVTIDPANPERALIPIELPWTEQDLLLLGGERPRGQFGRFVSNLAVTFWLMPIAVVRESLPEYAGLRLLFTAMAFESVQADGIPSYAADVLLDVPAERQRHGRNVMACDGRGYAYHVSRPDGMPGAANLTTMPCLADPRKMGYFLHETGDGQWLGPSLLPWGLDMLARRCRAVFEEETPCPDGSDGSDGSAAGSGLGSEPASAAGWHHG